MDEGALIQFVVLLLVQLAINLVIGGLVAWFLGRKRIIGFGWSLFFSCALTFLIGFIITMLSPKYESANLGKSKIRLVFGWILLTLGVFMVWAVYRVLTTDQPLDNFNGFSVGSIVAAIGGGIYLIKRSKGASFHSRQLRVEDSV